jgi:hypothetical protein
MILEFSCPRHGTGVSKIRVSLIIFSHAYLNIYRCQVEFNPLEARRRWVHGLPSRSIQRSSLCAVVQRLAVAYGGSKVNPAV